MQKHIKRNWKNQQVHIKDFNIIENKGQDIQGRPDAVLFRKGRRKILYERILKKTDFKK